jgi:drug/metabolite transporter (DMT)-like permease
VKKIDKLDICKLILKIFIIYLIIDPCIYMSIKKTDNPGSAKAIVNLNTALTFILSIYLLNKKFTYKNLLFILIIVIFSLLLR